SAQAQRAAAASARSGAARAERQYRRGARPLATATAYGLGAIARGRPDPRALPTQPRDRGAGGPLRDPDLVRGAGLPAQQEEPRTAGGDRARARDPADEHPHQPEPPVDPPVEHRQRTAD